MQTPSPTPFFNFDFRTIDLRTVLAAISAIIAFIALVYFTWWKNRKRLSYYILSDVSLVSASEVVRDRVEIRFEGKPVKNVWLIVIKLINDGHLPIKKDEFEQPLKFLFPKSKVLNAEKIKFKPKNIATTISYTDEEVEIAPALFNRKDYIEFKVLVSDYQQHMTIDARIVGVSNVQQVGSNTHLVGSSFLRSLGLLLAVVLSSIVLYKGSVGLFNVVRFGTGDLTSMMGNMALVFLALTGILHAIRNIRFRD
jgi:hypothetical protein